MTCPRSMSSRSTPRSSTPTCVARNALVERLVEHLDAGDDGLALVLAQTRRFRLVRRPCRRRARYTSRGDRATALDRKERPRRTSGSGLSSSRTGVGMYVSRASMRLSMHLQAASSEPPQSSAGFGAAAERWESRRRGSRTWSGARAFPSRPAPAGRIVDGVDLVPGRPRCGARRPDGRAEVLAGLRHRGRRWRRRPGWPRPSGPRR